MNISEKLIQVAENEQKVYDAGYAKGFDEGGYAEGVKAEYDKFWDRYQARGSDDYTAVIGRFNGNVFGFDNFYPKYDIRPVGKADNLFYAWENKYGDSSGSLKQRLLDCGVVLDTSKATSLTSAFSYSHITELPVIDVTSAGTNTKTLFAHNYERMQTIEKIIVNEDNTFPSWFTNSNPTEVRFEGTIANDLAINYGSHLSKASIESILDCLKDFSGETDDAEGYVSGKYYWNSTIPQDDMLELLNGKTSHTENVQFTVEDYLGDGENRDGTYIEIDDTYIGYNGFGGFGVPEYGYSGGGWLRDSARVIDFGSTAQTVSSEFWNFLTANATKLYHTLSLGPNLEKLTDEEIAIATQKGWTLA